MSAWKPWQFKLLLFLVGASTLCYIAGLCLFAVGIWYKLSTSFYVGAIMTVLSLLNLMYLTSCLRIFD